MAKFVMEFRGVVEVEAESWEEAEKTLLKWVEHASAPGLQESETEDLKPVQGVQFETLNFLLRSTRKGFSLEPA